MQSTSNSAPLTVFSQQQAHSLGSLCSSPPRSRDQSPARLPFHPKAQSTIFEERPEVLPSPVWTSGVSNFWGRGQSVVANVCSTEVLPSDLALSKRNETTEMNVFEQGDGSTPARSTSANSQKFLSLDTVGGLFNEPHGSGVGVGGPPTCSDDSSDEDIDLEQSADKFLSEKFGISLSRLRRPHRIIYAFQQVKNQCVGILEDEGHQFVGSPRSEDSESEPIDGGDTYHSTSGNSASSIPNSYFTSPGTKRPNGDNAESEGLSGAGTLVKTRRYKKRRIGGDFSCPYRKRNPRRFNVRDYPDCANKSYEEFPTLKKHLTAQHYKKEATVCERCNERCETEDALLAHLKQCPNPPPNRAPIQYTDPEDGFDKKTENMLKSRKSSDQINNWTTLWGRLFPADTFVPRPGANWWLEFEPVVEDHDLLYIYKCSQSQISQRIDALAPGLSSKQIKALVFEEIESLFKYRSSHGQYPSPSSNSSTSQMQPVVEGESNLSANPLVPERMARVSNPEWLGQHTQGDSRDRFGFDGLTQLSSTDATRQPLTRYGFPTAPNNQSFVSCFPDLAEPSRETGPRTPGLTHGNSELDMPQQHPELFCTEPTPFNQNAFPQTRQDHHWVLNNDYHFEADPAIGWPDSSGFLEYDDLDDAGC
ncbi:hypothetical protein NUW58_g6100 [Xylaria curta]|uniref:Uncharacterized protein n=1 Tax=Xylaria curta TaxID=42375 RepID=A0ACC1P0Y4_9PEZI|nr:hypothetical protein NUW58_g6100 [Xylaria curta]